MCLKMYLKKCDKYFTRKKYLSSKKIMFVSRKECVKKYLMSQ